MLSILGVDHYVCMYVYTTAEQLRIVEIDIDELEAAIARFQHRNHPFK